MPLILTRRAEPWGDMARAEFDPDVYPGKSETRGAHIRVNPGITDGEELRHACVLAMEAALCEGFEAIYFGARDSVVTPDALTEAVKAAAGNFLENGCLTIYLHCEDTPPAGEEPATAAVGLRARLRRLLDRLRAGSAPADTDGAREELGAPPAECPSSADVDAALRERLDEGFARVLLRRIGEKGLSDGQCCRRANVDRRLLARLRGDERCPLRKTEAAAFAVALELSAEEARELLAEAGYSLSRRFRFDVIVEYFLQRGEYDVYAINEALFRCDQPQLGTDSLHNI